jgi:hypothetical protein
MPRVYLNDNDRLSEHLSAWIYGQMKMKQITQKDMAEHLFITASAFNQKLKKKKFSFNDFLTIVRILEPDADELVRLTGGKRRND